MAKAQPDDPAMPDRADPLPPNTAPGLDDLTEIRDTMDLRIVRQIAQGGMGVVYEARQCGVRGFEKTVAIKVMRPQLGHPRFRDMFVAEAKLVADLVHENIVQIYHLGMMPSGYYMVMEYVHGLALRNLILRHATAGMRLPANLAVFIASRIARGLAYAHKRQSPTGEPLRIVHRDVCPNNILITTEGLPKLTDFGVATGPWMGESSRPRLAGKWGYMAPEQSRGEDIDFRADIFALGAVLFELLALQPIRALPPDGPVMPATGPLVIPWEALPVEVPDPLRSILRRMLAEDRRDRYQDTDLLAYDLEYHIYEHGYGPTIQVLEQYLRRHVPYLYTRMPDDVFQEIVRQTTLAETTTRPAALQ
jgi:serine/threonine protein kinase